MPRENFLRRHFHNTSLVRLIGAWLPTPVEPPRQDLAQRLAQWLSVSDAITLHSAQRNPHAVPLAPSGSHTPAGRNDDLASDLQRLRATLANSFTDPGGRSSDMDPVTAVDFAPHHQRYLDHQRRMELGLDALRTHAREVLAAASPPLAQLAALDAQMHDLLREREQALLSRIPVFLKTRFLQLRPTEEAVLESVATETAPAWLAAFEQETQACLLAELEVRAQPLTGLVEAWSTATEYNVTE